MLKFSKNIIILILFMCLSGCANTDKRSVIRFSSWGSESETALLRPILEQFEQENPDIRVDFIHIPKNYFQKLHLMVASNLTPDVIFLNNLNAPVYAKNNVLEDLNPYFVNDKGVNTSDFFKKSLDAFRVDDNLYALPRDVSNIVVYYNKVLFDKYGVAYPSSNWTYADYLERSKQLTKDINCDGKTDIYGSSFEENSLFWLPFLWGDGGGIISQDLKYEILSKKESIDALQFYADLRNKYHVAPTRSEQGSATMAQMFMQCKVAMHISGRWNVPRYRKDIEFDWDIAKFPQGSKGSIVDADASGWAISKSSKHKDQSWRLIKYLSSQQSVEKMTESGLIVPARVDVANSSVFLAPEQKPKNSRVFIDIIDESIPTPVNENYQEINDIVNSALESVWVGKSAVKEVVDEKLVKQIQNLLN